MVTIKKYTVLIEDDVYRIKQQWKDTYLFGIRVKREIDELWRKATLVPDELRAQVLAEDKNTCVYCGLKSSSMAIDHVIPQKDGGLTIFENLVTTCKKCNSSKNGRTPEEAGMALRAGRYRFGPLSTVTLKHKVYKAVLDATNVGRVIVMTPKDHYYLPACDSHSGVLYSELQQRTTIALDNSLTWGYDGKGPRDTAYSILCDFISAQYAQIYYCNLARTFIAQLPQACSWTLTGKQILDWLDSAETDEHLLQRLWSEHEQQKARYWTMRSQEYAECGWPYGKEHEGLMRWHEEQGKSAPDRRIHREDVDAPLDTLFEAEYDERF